MFFFFKGRIAFYAILKAIGISENDEILLPGFTCVVVPNAIIYLGAKPVYIDINPNTYNIDPSKLEEKITPRTKAIVVQHTFGIPSEMDIVLDIARKHNIYVIEDSCHAIGSKYKGKEVGTFGDAAFFSSQWSKPVTTGLGGWAIINNPKIKKNLEEIYSKFRKPSFVENSLLRLQYALYSSLLTPSFFWIIQDVYRFLSHYGIAIGSSSKEELESKMPLDYKKIMSKWQKELLSKKLKNVSQIIKHRKWVTLEYEKYLPQIGIKPVSLSEDINSVFLRYPVLIKDKRKCLEEARKYRVEIGDWFSSPVHPKLSEWSKVKYERGMCPVSEEICSHIINLPTHLKIKEKEINKIIDFLASINK
jgi:perosamine synthetase